MKANKLTKTQAARELQYIIEALIQINNDYIDPFEDVVRKMKASRDKGGFLASCSGSFHSEYDMMLSRIYKLKRIKSLLKKLKN